jgi:hypothetical protein
MKKFIVIVMLLFSTTAFADEVCESLRKVAEQIMKNRQIGVPINEMIEVADNNHPKVKEILKALIIDAYGSPKFNTPKVINEAVNEFGNKVYVDCVKARR